MHIFALHPVFYLFFLIALAFSVDMRALWCALPVCAGLIPAARDPQLAFLCNGISGSVAALFMAAIWWRDDRRERRPVASAADSR